MIASVYGLHYQMKATLMKSFDTSTREYYRLYQGAYDFTLKSMTQVATLIANDQDILQNFYLGAKAVKQEGGGAGGSQSAHFREQLLQHIQPSWQEMTQNFGVRQLHFHLAPGDTSFLRVHTPTKYGDDLSNLRHIIVDVNRDQRPRQGFELGRIYSGIRSVLPLYIKRPDQTSEYIGALETGTSFSSILESLKEIAHIDSAVIIDTNRIDNAMWEVPSDKVLADCACYLETSTNKNQEKVETFAKRVFESFPDIEINTPKTQLIHLDNAPYVVANFAIQDYVGERDQLQTGPARVIIWYSVQSELNALYKTTFIYSIIALVAFLLIDIMLALGIRYTFKALQREVDEQTDALSRANTQLKLLAYHDPLTGLLNRRALLEQFEVLFDESKQHHIPLSVLIIDIDYFKSVNDQYGHQMGDQVLAFFAAQISMICEPKGIVGRYGGEEFCVILPNFTLSQAVEFANRIRIESTQSFLEIGPVDKAITCSIGVAEIHNALNSKELIAQADLALYKAKASGRNKACF